MTNMKFNSSQSAKRKKQVINVLLTILAFTVVLLILFPILWTLTSVFKGKTELFQVPNTIFPKDPTWDNFKKIFTLRDFNFVTSLLSTFAVSATAVVLALAVNMLAAYAFARLEFRGKNILFSIVLATMFIPGITILLSSIKVVEGLGMLDTFWVLVIPGVASGYAVFFFRQFFMSIPQSIEEAALIDGANHFKIFMKIYIPMSVTPIIILGASTFMGYWNSYLWPTLTIIDNTALKQVMQVIQVLSTRYKGEYGIVIAATVISLILPLTMFGIFQKKIVEGVAITGLK
ncbi:MAG: carbohydrate ABC transporter permease [Clostridia bacterium]